MEQKTKRKPLDSGSMAGMTDKDMMWYVRELQSGECQCGRTKKKGKSFCWGCYDALPGHLQRDLYCTVGNEYEQAYDEAVKWLNQ